MIGTIIKANVETMNHLLGLFAAGSPLKHDVKKEYCVWFHVHKHSDIYESNGIKIKYFYNETERSNGYLKVSYKINDCDYIITGNLDNYRLEIFDNSINIGGGMGAIRIKKRRSIQERIFLYTFFRELHNIVKEL